MDRGIGKNLEELEKVSLPTNAFKEDINTYMFSSEFRESFGLGLWLHNKAFIDQFVPPIRENIRTLVFRRDLTLFGPYFKTAV